MTNVKQKKDLHFQFINKIVIIFAPNINNRGREPQNLIFMLRIRLQRHGKRGKPFYWIIATDSRSKRDGQYLEKIGTYDPLTNPATVKLDFDSALKWLDNGAQPSDTARDLLSSKGVLLKRHLLGGVRKGALTEEEAEQKFNEWLEEKEAKLEDRRKAHQQSEIDAQAKALEAEKEVNKKRAAALKPEPQVVDTPASAEKEDVAEAEEAPADDGKTEIERQAEAAKGDNKEKEDK